MGRPDVHRLADVLVRPSAYDRRLVEGYAESDAATTVVSNGVDHGKLEGCEALAEPCRRRYDLEPPVAFAVGQVIEREGLRRFVDTGRRLPNVDFAWLEDGRDCPNVPTESRPAADAAAFADALERPLDPEVT